MATRQKYEISFLVGILFVETALHITFNVIISPVVNAAIVHVPQCWCEVTHDVCHSEVVNEIT
jgi:hypothetical protein